MQINAVDNSELMVTAIRDVLRKAPEGWRIGRQSRQFLIRQLPTEWRLLIRCHGTRRVFPLLAANFTISAAQEELNGTL
jgi:hypothetical protein